MSQGYATATLLTGRSGPTALIWADDLITLGVMDAALDLALTIPGDAAVVGFHDGRVASLHQIALSTVGRPVAEMGRRAVGLLLDRITGGSTRDPVEVVLRPEMVGRQACGAASAHGVEPPSLLR